ncbi:AAA family ATPase [Methanomassiliicoccales archaeon LGM-DZ1]|nr:AAA family ATPase [Methanomassiliicoccales archaeon LGM-DZ1]
MAHVEIIRRAYLQKLREMMEQRDTIKIITGSRYSGKSYLLCQFRERLVSMGIPEGDIIFVPLEDRQAEISNAVQLESYVKASAPQSGGFLLIDDIQMIPDVGAALCRLCDRGLSIYAVLPYAATDQGAETVASLGKTEILNILPFSFKEFLDAYPISDEHGYGERFEQYIMLGGTPFIDIDANPKDSFILFEGVFNLILNWDIGMQTKIDTAAISRLAIYIFNNVSTITTLSALRQNSNVTDQRTVVKYIKYMIDYGMIMRADAIDLSDMRKLGVKAKYFVVNMRNSRGFTPRGPIGTQRENIIENLVFIELIRRGYEVYAGYYRGSDVGLYCVKDKEKMIVKTVFSVADDRAKGKDYKAFVAAPGKKVLLTSDRGMNGFYNGIEYKNIISFLLQ